LPQPKLRWPSTCRQMIWLRFCCVVGQPFQAADPGGRPASRVWHCYVGQDGILPRIGNPLGVGSGITYSPITNRRQVYQPALHRQECLCQPAGKPACSGLSDDAQMRAGNSGARGGDYDIDGSKHPQRTGILHCDVHEQRVLPPRPPHRDRWARHCQFAAARVQIPLPED